MNRSPGTNRSSAVAIVGCGLIGRIYGQQLAVLGAEVAAVVDPEESVRNRAAAEIGCRAYGSLAEMLAAEPTVGVVGISSPSQFHFPLTIEALAAGRHVLCEKPLALSLKEVRQMVETAQSHGLKLGVGFKMRFEPVFAETKRLIDAGTIGDPLRVAVTQHQAMPTQEWARRHGIADELLIHGIDLANWYLAAEPDEVWHANEGGRATVHLRFPYGRDAVVTGAWIEGFPPVAGHNDALLQLVGTKGHIVVRRPTSIVVNADRQARHVELEPSDYGEPFRHEWAAFLNWVQDGTPGQMATAEDGLRVHRLLARVNDKRELINAREPGEEVP
jgi:predicted dehydrogenase